VSEKPKYLKPLVADFEVRELSISN
jgi:hypothetical protein